MVSIDATGVKIIDMPKLKAEACDALNRECCVFKLRPDNFPRQPMKFCLVGIVFGEHELPRVTHFMDFDTVSEMRDWLAEQSRLRNHVCAVSLEDPI